MIQEWIYYTHALCQHVRAGRGGQPATVLARVVQRRLVGACPRRKHAKGFCCGHIDFTLAVCKLAAGGIFFVLNQGCFKARRQRDWDGRGQQQRQPDNANTGPVSQERPYVGKLIWVTSCRDCGDRAAQRSDISFFFASYIVLHILFAIPTSITMQVPRLLYASLGLGLVLNAQEAVELLVRLPSA